MTALQARGNVVSHLSFHGEFHCAHLIVLENTQADSVSSPVESCVVIGREASC